jgi:hypothetical protein
MGKPTNGSSSNGLELHAPNEEAGDEAGEEVVTEPFDRGEAPCPDAPVMVLELVASCHRMVAAAVGVPMDGTGDTLSLLDHYVREARQQLLEKPELQPVLEQSIGAYFGEMARRTYGGYWFLQGEPAAWRLRLSSVYVSFNPVGVAREALLNDHSEGWHGHAKVEDAYEPFVKARLDALGDVDADEYFLPSSRWDALEVVIAAVRERMVQEDETDGFFETSDYESEA